MDPGLRADVADLTALLPAGNTLATVDYQLAIPMLTTRFPQYGLWPIDLVVYYGTSQGALEESKMRYGAARYLIGQREFRADFERLLDTNVQNVVVSRRMGAATGAIKRVVQAHGLRLVADTPRYLAFTR